MALFRTCSALLIRHIVTADAALRPPSLHWSLLSAGLPRGVRSERLACLLLRVLLEKGVCWERTEATNSSWSQSIQQLASLA
eukprot:2011378-Pleurochrysis_carterae.AAC.1